MRGWIALAALLASLPLSLVFSTLTYALRDLSRNRLADALGKRGLDRLFEPILDNAFELAFLAGSFRLLTNMLALLALVELYGIVIGNTAGQYGAAIATAIVLLTLCSIGLPHALATHHGEAFVARWARLMLAVRVVAHPLTEALTSLERLVRPRRSDADEEESAENEAEEELLEAVEDATSAGAVDEQERRLIEKVIDFGDATADDAMTRRSEIVALPVTATLDEAREAIEKSGHSRIPVYEESIDKVIGILYARDLLGLWGDGKEFDMRRMLRTPLVVPQSTPLQNLLAEIQTRKVHIAIVLDEHGGTAGLITIEDIMEQIFGDIVDEHEPAEPPMIKHLGEHAAEFDARVEIDDVNAELGIELPDDEDYTTLGGFLTKAMARIPLAGETHESHGARFVVIAAEPQRIKRVRIERMDDAKSRSVQRELAMD